MQILYQRFHLLISKFFTFWIGAEAGAGAEAATKSNGSGSRGSKKGGSGSTTLISTMYSVHWWDLMKKSAENPVKSRIKKYTIFKNFSLRGRGGGPPHPPPWAFGPTWRPYLTKCLVPPLLAWAPIATGFSYFSILSLSFWFSPKIM